MKLTIKKPDAAAGGSVELPAQFTEPIREDLIIRSVLALQANRRQPYGGYGDAGLRHSADLSKRRRAYRGSYGRGQSRVPRKVHSRRGTQMYYVGAIVAGTVGGRRAHGPKPFKDWSQKVNKTENRKAIRSALSATVIPELVTARGHQLPEGFPFILDNSFEKLQKTKELETALVQLGLAAELERGAEKRIRAGKGKMRGRKYKRPVSVLFVTAQDGTALEKSVGNLPGMDVVAVHRLNAELLAPGAHPGRLTLFTQGAIERLEKEGLFTKNYKGPKVEKKVTKVVKKTPEVTKSKEKTAAKPAKKTADKAPKKNEVKPTPAASEKKEAPKVEVAA